MNMGNSMGIGLETERWVGREWMFYQSLNVI